LVGSHHVLLRPAFENYISRFRGKISADKWLSQSCLFSYLQYNNTGFGGSPHHSFSPNQPTYNQPSPTPPSQFNNPSTSNYYTPTPHTPNTFSPPNPMVGGAGAPPQPGPMYNNPMGRSSHMQPNHNVSQPYMPPLPPTSNLTPPNMGVGVTSQPPSTYFTPQEPINQPLGPPSNHPMGMGPTPPMTNHNYNIMNPSMPPSHGKLSICSCS